MSGEPAEGAPQAGETPASPKAPHTPEPAVAGERGITSINRASSTQARLSSLLAMALMLALGLGLLTWYYTRTLERHGQAQREAQRANHFRAQAEMPLPALGRVEPPLAEQFMGAAPPLPPNVNGEAHPAAYLAQPAYGVSTGMPTGGLAGGADPSVQVDRRLQGPVYAESTELGGPSVPRGAPVVSDSDGPDGVRFMGDSAQRDAGGRTVAALLTPSVTPAVRARVLPTQQMLLPKGAFIDCTLETAIDSSLPGLTTCITATDTFGADGKVVLLERGTKLVGETRGEVQQGIARVFVLWSEARTPTGVVVPLASPGTDELGRSGLPGSINRHFMERFGAAMLVSVIDGAVQAAVQNHNGGSSVTYNAGGSRDVLTEVLKSTVNITPTVIKHNGDRIQILVARDLDFRSVYELRTAAQ